MSIAATFRVGDKVSVPLPVGRVYGTVIEDRGPLGVARRHLFKVAVPNDPYEQEEFLVSDEEIQHLEPHEEAELQQTISHAGMVDFLVHGGLISILQRNSPEPVWLRRNSFGNVTYTFVAGYSGTGGQPAPRNALLGEKIIAVKKPEVIDFMRSLGLPDAMAETVVAKVGIAN